METSKRKKRSGVRMKRRTFVIIILSICGIAILTEGYLLSRTLFKKKNGKNATTPEATPTVTVEPVTLSPTATPPAETKTVRRLVKKTEQSSGNGQTTEYRYDTEERLTETILKADIFSEHTEFVYEQSGVRVIRWHLENGEEKTDSNYIEMAFWPNPIRQYENECYLIKESYDPAFVVKYDANGNWESIADGDNKGVSFKFDDKGRMQSYRLWVEGEETRLWMNEVRTLELTYDETDETRFTGTGNIANPGRKLYYDMRFENGKIVKSEVTMDGVKMEESTWEYKEDGFMKHSVFYIDNNTTTVSEIWNAPIPFPSQTNPYECAYVTVTKINDKEETEERFLKDAQGRIVGLSMKVLGSDAPPAEQLAIDYDSAGRICWYCERAMESKYTYNAYGEIEKTEYYMAGDLLMTDIYEYADVQVEVSK